MVDSVRSKLKIVKIVLWSILAVILLFMFIVAGALLVEKYIKKSPVPMFAGYGSMVVITGSMSSTINKGDLIIIKRFDEYNITDVVTYVMDNGTVVTHRLVNYDDKEAGTFITKGDANDPTDQEVGDPPVSMEQIRGKVVLTIPYVGLFFDWVLHDYGIVYIVALIAVVIAGVYFWHLTKSDSEENVEKAKAPSGADSDNPAATAEDSAANSATSAQDAVQPNEEPQENNNKS